MKTIKNKNIYLFIVYFLFTTFIIVKYNNWYANKDYRLYKKNTTIINDGKVKKENEGKLVLVSGKLDYNNEVLHDDYLGASVKTPRLTRTVLIYQWNEIKKTNSEGKKIYKYKKIWSNVLIDSDSFNEKNHKNPKEQIIGPKFFFAKKIKVGEFELPKKTIENLPWNKMLKLNSDIYLVPGFKIYKGCAVNSDDPKHPKIGDTQICYYYNNWEDVTILAKQTGNSFSKYKFNDELTANYFENGIYSLKEIIKK